MPVLSYTACTAAAASSRSMRCHETKARFPSVMNQATSDGFGVILERSNDLPGFVALAGVGRLLRVLRPSPREIPRARIAARPAGLGSCRRLCQRSRQGQDRGDVITVKPHKK